VTFVEEAKIIQRQLFEKGYVPVLSRHRSRAIYLSKIACRQQRKKQPFTPIAGINVLLVENSCSESEKIQRANPSAT
jgi:hypothetical protein